MKDEEEKSPRIELLHHHHPLDFYCTYIHAVLHGNKKVLGHG